MKSINLATAIRSNKLLEQQLMLNIRFGVLMFRRRKCELTGRRLVAAISAFHDHINLNGPSRWLEENFFRKTGAYAGLWWYVGGSYGAYELKIDDHEFTIPETPSLSLVK